MNERLSADFEEYQSRIMEEIKYIYTGIVINHALNPRNTGNLLYADGTSRITGPCSEIHFSPIRNDINNEGIEYATCNINCRKS